MAKKEKNIQKPGAEAGVENEKLRAYKTAFELATKFGQLVSVEGAIPPAIAGISLGVVTGVMTDLALGRNTRNMTNKLKYFSRARKKIARCNEIINLMEACGWIDSEEYKQMNEDVVSLSKMVWGLVKMLRERVNGEKTIKEEAKN